MVRSSSARRWCATRHGAGGAGRQTRPHLRRAQQRAPRPQPSMRVTRQGSTPAATARPISASTGIHFVQDLPTHRFAVDLRRFSGAGAVSRAPRGSRARARLRRPRPGTRAAGSDRANGCGSLSVSLAATSVFGSGGVVSSVGILRCITRQAPVDSADGGTLGRVPPEWPHDDHQERLHHAAAEDDEPAQESVGRGGGKSLGDDRANRGLQTDERGRGPQRNQQAAGEPPQRRDERCCDPE